MAFCKGCGKPIEDNIRFCSICGTDQESAANPPYSIERDVQENKAMAILSYLGILVLIPYFAVKDSPFARFHAIQGLNLLIFGAIASFAMSIISVLFVFLFFLGFLIAILWFLIGGLFVTLVVLGIINACKGEMKPLPIIDKYKIVKQ